MHYQAALSVKYVGQGLLPWVSLMLLIRIVVLQRDHLCPVLHLLVDPLYRAHDLVLVEQHPAFLLFHPVADPFPYRSDEPQV